MKCPKCGYNSFESLASCKKCSTDLSEHKAKFGLRGFAAPEEQSQTAAEDDLSAVAADQPASDFGFDFLEEDASLSSGQPSEEGFSLDDDSLSLEQPFGVDAENIPADQTRKD